MAARSWPSITLMLALMTLTALAPGCAAWRRTSEAQVILGRRKTLEGMEAVDRGDWTRAESLFADAIRLNPRDERTHSRYAEVLWRRGDVDAAAQHLQHSVRLSVDDPDLLIRLGRLRLEQGRLEDAQTMAERAVSLDPSHAAARRLLGDVWRDRGKLEDALAAYHQALRLTSKDAELVLSVAEIYRDLNKPQRAYATLEVLGDDFSGHEIWEVRAWALQCMGHDAEALAARQRLAADFTARQTATTSSQ